MPTNMPPSSGERTPRVRRVARHTTFDLEGVECYCGLGPACYRFREMTDEERIACSRDKRATAQSFFRNGMEE